MGYPKIFFLLAFDSLIIKLSFETLNIKIGAPWAPLDPKTKKRTPKPRGWVVGKPPVLIFLSLACEPTLNLSTGRKSRIIDDVTQKMLTL